MQFRRDLYEAKYGLHLFLSVRRFAAPLLSELLLAVDHLILMLSLTLNLQMPNPNGNVRRARYAPSLHLVQPFYFWY